MKSQICFLSFFVLLLAAFSVSGAEKDYHGQDLSKQDFSGESLNGADFSDAILTEAKFNQASLKKANFRGANIKWAKFHGADLTEADFRETSGVPHSFDAIFNKANFEGLTFQLAHGCKYRGTNMQKCKISGIADQHMDFSGADLRGANLRGVYEISPLARWKGAVYDEDTAFPEGFNPVAAGLTLAQPAPKKDPASDDAVTAPPLSPRSPSRQ